MLLANRNKNFGGLKKLGLALLIIAVLIGVQSLDVNAESEHSLTLMATADLHQYILSYDYMNDEPYETYGFSKTYTLIEEVREERENTLLFDAGDAIQGSMIGNYEALVDPLEEGETQAIIEAMNHAGYVAAGVGNHEVQDFGLDFFDLAIEGSEFPWIAANLFDSETDDYYTQPYEIIEKDLGGETLEIGVIAFVPPEIMQWGRTHLLNEVYVEGIMESAEQYIPELADKTDLLVVASHTGIGEGYEPGASSYEAGYKLAQMDEVDAFLGGHSHSIFPSEDYEYLDEVDIDEGTIAGTPASKPGRWGEALSVIDLDLAYNDGEWEVVGHNVEVREVEPDTEEHVDIIEIAAEVHYATVDYVRTPIGSTEIPIKGYFSEIKDTAVTQIVNDAQLWYAEEQLADSDYEDYPILSVAAPFQTSTAVREDITIGDVTDIYLYDNTVYILEMDGEQVIEFLERTAEHFSQLDPDADEAQVIDILGPSFNYDVIEGIEYEIDITQPEGERIVNATYEGEPLDDEMTFAVITNDYRAGGGGEFPHTGDDAEVIFSSADANRDQIIFYIEEYGEINPVPSGNWNLKAHDFAGPVKFDTHAAASDYIEEMDRIQGIEFVEYVDDDTARFELDFDVLGWD